jgi:hypothetical protein
MILPIFSEEETKWEGEYRIIRMLSDDFTDIVKHKERVAAGDVLPMEVIQSADQSREMLITRVEKDGLYGKLKVAK